MNLPLLASDIVRRVHHSPDSVTNLEEVVANLIRHETDQLRKQIGDIASYSRHDPCCQSLESLLEYAQHSPTCHKPYKPCDCGLEELLEQIGK